MPRKHLKAFAWRLFFVKPVANKISDSDPYFVQTLLLGRLIRTFADLLDEGVINI